MNPRHAALIGTLGVALTAAAWRHYRWPCPSWLVPLLENPYFNAVAGAEALLDRAGVTRGMTVLDAGCGPGRVTLPAARRVGAEGHVVGLDVQEGMLRHLRERLDRDHVANVELLRGGLGEGRLPRDRFDVALLVTVLGEIPDPMAALCELRDTLRPGGRLSITEVLPDPHYQTLARARRLVGEAGLDVEQVTEGRLSFTLNATRP